MHKQPHKSACTFCYALVHFATWSFYAIVLAFSSNVLYEFGFSDSAISLFMGGFTALSVVVQVTAAELLSKLRTLGVHRVLVAFGTIMLVSAGILMIPGVPSPVSIVSFGINCMLLQTLPSLSNSMGMDSIRRGAPTNYSTARAMGSLGYSIAALLTGSWVRKMGVISVHLLTIAVSVQLITSVLLYHRCIGNQNTEEESVAARDTTPFFSRYPRFGIFLAGMSLLCVSHGLLCNFMYQIMLSRSAEAMEQGIATAISSLVELPIMFGFPWLAKKARCDKWVRFAAFAMALKPLMILLSGGPVGIYFAQATQSIGYGLWVIGSVNYAERIVAKGESIRAQSYHGSVTTASTVVALSIGGVIIEHLGVQTMLAVSLPCSLLGASVILFSAEKTE